MRNFLAQVAQESLGLSRVVRAFGTEEKESNKYIRYTLR